jgi:hypothetical protein
LIASSHRSAPGNDTHERKEEMIMMRDYRLKLAALAAVAAAFPAALPAAPALAEPTTQVPDPHQPMPMPQMPQAPVQIPQHTQVQAPAPTPVLDLAPKDTQPPVPHHTQTITQLPGPHQPMPTPEMPQAPVQISQHTQVQAPAPTPVLEPAPQHTQPPAPQHTQPPAPQHTQPPAPQHTRTLAPSPPTYTTVAEPQPSVTHTATPEPHTTPPSHAPAGVSPTPSQAPRPSVSTPSHSVTQTPALRTTPGPGGNSAVITHGSTTTQIPVATTPDPIAVSRAAAQAAKTAHAARIDAAQPPALPPNVDFNQQVRTVIQVNADQDQGLYRPKHWDFVDYDEYRRPFFYNPVGGDVTFRYFYGGQYRTVFVPAGGRVLLDAAVAGLFAFTAVAGELLSVGSFLGGAWIPPVDWVGPPPADWQPWVPVAYDQVPVYFPAADQTVAVDRITMVGHDDSLPVGQQDVFQLNDSALARGQVTPAPDGGPPQVTVAQTQSLPGVSPWDNGQAWINTSVPKPPVAANNHLPWIIGGLAAVLAALATVAAWVWTHPRGAHAKTEPITACEPTTWIYSPYDDEQLSRP